MMHYCKCYIVFRQISSTSTNCNIEVLLTFEYINNYAPIRAILHNNTFLKSNSIFDTLHAVGRKFSYCGVTTCTSVDDLSTFVFLSLVVW